MLATGCGGGDKTPPVSPPALITTSLQTNENAAITQTLAASDPNGSLVTFAKVTDPPHGVVTVEASGKVTYTPTAYFHGTDSFLVSLTNAMAASSVGQVSVTVNYINYPPIAHDDQLRIAAGSVTLPILANDDAVDGEPLTVSILTQPIGGTVTVSNGTLVSYQPQNGFAGPASFTYRIADPSGLSADATAHLVVGHFSGIVMLADETTPGTRELHYYDGFKTARLSAALPAGATIQGFKLAPDGRHVGYVVAAPLFTQVLVADVTNPGSAQLIYTGTPQPIAPARQITLNRDASFVLIQDPYAGLAHNTVLARSSDASYTLLATSNPTVQQQLDFAFNPVSNEFYVQGQVGGSSPPLSGTGFTTLFAATTASPDPLTQIGASYAVSNGSGSGIAARATPDGRRILHEAVAFTSTGSGISTFYDLLVNDRTTGSETYLYRQFGALELAGVGANTFDISGDGSGVCFVLNQLPASGTFSRGQVWMANPAAPGSASAVSPVADYNFGCQWAADSKSIVYVSSTGSAPGELWVAKSTQPGVAVRLREPLVGGQTLQYSAIAHTSMGAIVAVSGPGTTANFYRADIGAPGSSTLFYTSPSLFFPGISIDAAATSVLIIRNEPVSGGIGTINRLHWISSQTTNDDLLLSRPDATAGVTQAEFLP